MTSAEAAARIAFAMDVGTAAEARRLAACLAGRIGVIKVGLELFIAQGPGLVRELGATAPIFLDLKIHDIPATMEGAARAAARLGVRYLTVHGAAGERGVRAAVAAAPEVKVLVVTLLTSVSPEEAAGEGRTPEAVVRQRALMARDAGAAGVVTSGHEARAARAVLGPHGLVVVPGIRPAEWAPCDQRRVSTPGAAMAAGADLLVVGRPIRDAPDPAEAAHAIAREMAGGV